MQSCRLRRPEGRSVLREKRLPMATFFTSDQTPALSTPEALRRAPYQCIGVTSWQALRQLGTSPINCRYFYSCLGGDVRGRCRPSRRRTRSVRIVLALSLTARFALCGCGAVSACPMDAIRAAQAPLGKSIICLVLHHRALLALHLGHPQAACGARGGIGRAQP